MTDFRKWQLFAPLGLALIGLGLSLLGHSIGIKISGASSLVWFSWGTVSLLCINAGIAIFGEALKARVLYELKD
jgi:hypothetical protein